MVAGQLTVAERRWRRVALAMVALLVLLGFAFVFELAGRRRAEQRLGRVLERENNRCNRVRTYLEDILREKPDVARNLWLAIEREVPDCVTDRKAAAEASGDIHRLLQLIPARDIDDQGLSEP